VKCEGVVIAGRGKQEIIWRTGGGEGGVGGGGGGGGGGG